MISPLRSRPAASCREGRQGDDGRIVGRERDANRVRHSDSQAAAMARITRPPGTHLNWYAERLDKLKAERGALGAIVRVRGGAQYVGKYEGAC
jgi:hypothetical protein